MRNYATGSLSFRAPRAVIPSAARNLIKSSWGYRMRFFTLLRSVQNDMAGGSVQNDMTEGGLSGAGPDPMLTCRHNLIFASCVRGGVADGCYSVSLYATTPMPNSW